MRLVLLVTQGARDRLIFNQGLLSSETVSFTHSGAVVGMESVCLNSLFRAALSYAPVVDRAGQERFPEIQSGNRRIWGGLQQSYQQSYQYSFITSLLRSTLGSNNLLYCSLNCGIKIMPGVGTLVDQNWHFFVQTLQIYLKLFDISAIRQISGG